MISAMYHDVKFVRHSNAVAAGSTVIDTLTGIDMAGYDNISFIVAFGAIVGTAVTSVKAQQSSDNASADDWTDITGTSISVADTDDNKILVLDLLRPQKRYVRLYISRGTANATVDGVIAMLWEGKLPRPITQPTASVLGGEVHYDEAEGTA